MNFKPEDKADGKGRNGYFQIEEIVIWESIPDDYMKEKWGETDTMNVEIYSKRRGHAAPIRLEMSPMDLWRLGQAFQKASVSKATLVKTNKPM